MSIQGQGHFLTLTSFKTEFSQTPLDQSKPQ